MIIALKPNTIRFQSMSLMRLFPLKMKDSTIIQALMERHWQGYLSNVGYLGKRVQEAEAP